MLNVGDSVEKYVVERTLGQGGLASVFLVRHRQLGGLHALKVLSSVTRDQQERLMREGQAQATLRHPNIVEVRDVVDVNGSLGLLMEYVEGPTLAALLAERRLRIDEVDSIFAGILAAVGHAHAAKLIHRDLKPANVLLAHGPRGFVPKVTDFGLVKLMGDEGGPAQTKTNMLMGTPEYMSPEQIREPKTADHLADVFALGCILYELLARVSPFQRQDFFATFSAIVAGRYRPIDEEVPGLPARFARTIAACVQVEREDRPQNCAAVAEMLDVGPVETPAVGEVSGSSIRAPWSAATLAPRSMAANPSQPSMMPRAPMSRPVFRGGLLLVAGLGAFAIAIGVGGAVVGGGYFFLGVQESPGAVTIPAVTDAVATTVPLVAAAPPAGVEVVKSRPEPATTKTPKAGTLSPPRAAPVPVPTPTVEATPPAPVAVEAPSTGSVVVTGDATRVRLVGGSGAVEPGTRVVPGHYRVEAAFGGGEPAPAGAIDVVAGGSIRLQCSSVFGRCDVR